MPVAGNNRVVDLTKLGPSLLIATALVVAVRTARWPAVKDCATASSREIEGEINFALELTSRILATLLAKKADLFTHRDDPWWAPDDEDSPA